MRAKNKQIIKIEQNYKNIIENIQQDKHRKKALNKLVEDRKQFKNSFKQIKSQIEEQKEGEQIQEPKTPTKINNFVQQLHESSKKLQEMIDENAPELKQQEQQQNKNDIPQEFNTNLKLYIPFHNIKPKNINEYFEKCVINLISSSDKKKLKDENINKFIKGMAFLDEHYKNQQFSLIKLKEEIDSKSYDKNKYKDLFIKLGLKFE